MKQKELIKIINDKFDEEVLADQKNIVNCLKQLCPKPNRNVEKNFVLRMDSFRDNGVCVYYPSITEAAKAVAKEYGRDDYTDIAHNISKCIKGKRPTAYNSIWRLIGKY